MNRFIKIRGVYPGGGVYCYEDETETFIKAQDIIEVRQEKRECVISKKRDDGKYEMTEETITLDVSKIITAHTVIYSTISASKIIDLVELALQPPKKETAPQSFPIKNNPPQNYKNQKNKNKNKKKDKHK